MIGQSESISVSGLPDFLTIKMATGLRTSESSVNHEQKLTMAT